MTDRQSHSMTCQEARHVVHEHLDGAAGREALQALDAHLTGCADCRSYAAQMRSLVGALGHLRRASETTGHSKGATFSIYRLSRIAAAILIVFGLGLYLARPRYRPDARLAGNVPQSPVSTKPTAPPTDVEAPRPPASLELTGECARSYVSIERHSGRRNVHVFMLYPLSQAAFARADLHDPSCNREELMSCTAPLHE
jgi:hypothetical protein